MIHSYHFLLLKIDSEKRLSKFYLLKTNFFLTGNSKSNEQTMTFLPTKLRNYIKFVYIPLPKQRGYKIQA
jgi:hypothetical protein